MNYLQGLCCMLYVVCCMFRAMAIPLFVVAIFHY